ncbi:MAG: 2-dehydropantoate 2-reductase [Pseudomonadota bacterium]
MTQPNVVVFGAGSIGCYLGGLLASQGVPVRFIGRPRFQKELAEHGLTLTHYERPPIDAAPDTFTFTCDAEDLQHADVVLVTVKSQDSLEAGATLARSVRSDAIVISLQNGIRNPDTLKSRLPDSTVLGGMVPFNVTRTAPGTFHCGTEGDLIVAAHASDALAQLRDAFGKAGQSLNLVDNIAATQWGKLLVNLNNAMNTLSGGTLKAGLMQRPYRQALALMIEESLAVVSMAGIKPEKFGGAPPRKMIRILRLPNFLYRIIMNTIVKIDASARSSMLDDLDAGRPPEIDYLQGEIVRLAKTVGTEAPINATIMALVKVAFEKGRSPCMSGEEILAAIN